MELEPHTVVSCHVAAGNLTTILWKSSQCSKKKKKRKREKEINKS